MKVLEGLRFKRATSLIHRLDPRIKFIVSCEIFVLSILFKELLMLSIIFLGLIPLILLARIYLEWSRSLKGGSILIILIFATNLAASYLSSEFQLTREMITNSTAMVLRFVTLMTSFSLFFLTTSPDDLGLALEQSKIPYEFCFAFTTAIRFVPVLANEAKTIVDAQRSRGLELEKGNFLNRIRNYIPILIPLIVNAIRRSLELAEAMESRAFGVKKHRTSLYNLKIKSTDYLFLLVFSLIFLLAIYIRLNIPIPMLEIPFP